MWFGGPNMALQGNSADIRRHNDELLALAAKHPKALPIAPVYPSHVYAALVALKTKFIFAHLGGMNFRFWNIIAAARTAEGLFGENIYFDISATVAMVA